MRDYILLGLSVMLLCGYSVPSWACPTSCTCADGLQTVDCSNAGLSAVPTDIPANVTTLILSHNTITRLGDGTFSNFSSLAELDISFNLLENISQYAFQNLTVLLRLHLNNNQLHQLELSFDPLTSLTYLNLGFNSLTTLPSGIFSNCVFLYNLLLNNNNFNETVFDTLKPFFWISYIKLSHNDVTRLPYKFLTGLASLDTLEVDHNQIDCIDSNALWRLRALSFLNLADNQISTVKREMFQGLEMITELNFTSNPLVCNCDMRKFQDWILQDSGGATLSTSTSCYDYNTNSNIDIETGDFTHLCQESASDYCQDGSVFCSEKARIWMEVSTAETTNSMFFILKYQGISGNARTTLDCSYFEENITFSLDLRINETYVVLSEVKPGKTYGCCSQVKSCDMYTCAQDTFKPDNSKIVCANAVPYIATLCLVAMLLMVAIIVIIYLVHRQSNGVDLPTKQDFLSHTANPNDRKMTSQFSINPNDNRQTSLSMISMNTNPPFERGEKHNPMEGRPLPHPSSIKARPESTYEHIPAESIQTSELNEGFINKTFSGGAHFQPTSHKLTHSDGNVSSADAARVESHNLSKSHPDFSSSKSPQAVKKTRRFVKPRSDETLTPVDRTRCDTMPTVNSPRLALTKQDRVLSVAQVDSPRLALTKQDRVLSAAQVDSTDKPPPHMALPPKTNPHPTAQLDGTSNDDVITSGEGSSGGYQYIKDS